MLREWTDDYVEVRFTAEHRVERFADGRYEIRVEFGTSSESLGSLISQGTVAYALLIDCAKTRFRTQCLANGDQITLQVEPDKFSGLVELFAFMVSRGPITGFTSGEFHPDFVGEEFDIEPGDILAEAPRWWFIEDDPGPEAGITDLFLVSRSTQPNPPALDFRGKEGGKIEILLPPESFRMYDRMRKIPAFVPLIDALVVAPVFTELIGEIKSDLEKGRSPEDGFGQRWYRAIHKKIENMDPGMTAVALAQQVMKGALVKALDQTGKAGLAGGDGEDA